MVLGLFGMMIVRFHKRRILIGSRLAVWHRSTDGVSLFHIFFFSFYSGSVSL